MAEVGNNVLILYSKAHKSVTVDVEEEGLHLYDNSSYVDKNDTRVTFLLKDFLFSGIMLHQLKDIVKCTVVDHKGNILRHILHKGYIYMEFADTEYYLMKFEPKHRYWAGDSFTPVFVEKNLEANECDFLEIKRKL